ncbi:MAG: hypothetical protein AAGJ50_05205, partial [Pseudomonadota bacterium]
GWRGEEQDTVIETTGGLIDESIARKTFSGKLNLNAPISLPRPLPGEVTLNGNIDLRHLSDFGLLTTLGAGATWRPLDRLRLLLSFTEEDGAPTLENLGAPLVTTPNTRIFDFQTGTDVFAPQISGGSPDLLTDSRRVYKLGLQWTPQETPRFQVNVDYTRSRIENEVRTFLLLTDAFETAFPDRIIRDVSGQLLSFDRTPVQASLSRRDAIRTVLSFSKRLKAKRVRRRGPPPKKRRRSGRPGSLRLSVVHNWTLKDQVEISDNTPAFDFLNGASGIGLGGTPAHIVDLSVNRWNNGFGLTATGRYQSGSFVDSPEGDLSFSDLILTNIRLSYEFNYNDLILNVAPFLEETRVSFGIDNMLDQRLSVTDDLAGTPLNFQQDILDPLGRTFRFEIRRRF